MVRISLYLVRIFSRSVFLQPTVSGFFGELLRSYFSKKLCEREILVLINNF